MGSSSNFEVIFVCTGNRARSAIAEALFREATVGLPVSVSSAGTLELQLSAALPEAIAVCDRIGLDLSGHRSRYVGGVSLETTDLILGFEEGHSVSLVVGLEAPREKTFLFKELCRLLTQQPLADGLESDPIELARARIEDAHSLRSKELTFYPDDEIADPWGEKMARFEALVEELRAGIDVLVAKLFDR